MTYRDFVQPAALVVALCCGAATVTAQPPSTNASSTAEFYAENDDAMAAMMNGMTIKPTGDVDKDFARTMIAHHQGAIDMAKAELRHGTNELLRRIAQEIIVDQLGEIVAMQLATGTPLSEPRAAPTGSDPVAQSPTQSPPLCRAHRNSPTVRNSSAWLSEASAKWELIE
jgi:hypothetical protein